MPLKGKFSSMCSTTYPFLLFKGISSYMSSGVAVLNPMQMNLFFIFKPSVIFDKEMIEEVGCDVKGLFGGREVCDAPPPYRVVDK